MIPLASSKTLLCIEVLRTCNLEQISINTATGITDTQDEGTLTTHNSHITIPAPLIDIDESLVCKRLDWL